MRGQTEAVSIIMISGILIGVVGSVYFWGLPLIQKNKDVAVLENSEDFIRNLNTKIKFIANNGGRDQIDVNIPASVKFDTTTGLVELVVPTDSTIYATDAEIPIAKNSVCSSDTGEFSVADPETICVKSVKLSSSNYKTTYTLKYISLINNLSAASTYRVFKISLESTSSSGRGVGGEHSTIIFENKGTTSTIEDTKTIIKTKIEMSIV
ncbi:hypothetical protein HYZ41_04810 [archaeon]|nr:hypothetical protein [archaeon]